MTITFEQGQIRPPGEARSLLIRATRNCPWNKCAFCGVYKDEKFSRRSSGCRFPDRECRRSRRLDDLEKNKTCFLTGRGY